MAELILPENRNDYLHVLEEMFERRYELFFDGLGWLPEECGVEPGYDKDQFDKDDTVYIVERTSEGRVVGFCRINPTIRPHMMTDVFADYCDHVPVGPHIHEVSRLGYDYRLLNRDRDAWNEVRARVTTAITDYCLRAGISQVTYCVHEKIYFAIKRDTWGAEKLGEPVQDTRLNQVYQAGISNITHRALERCRNNLIDPTIPALMYHGPTPRLRLPEAA